MELKGQEKEMRSLSSLGYNPIFRESAETLDHHHLQQSSLGQGRRPNSDQLFEPKSSGSNFKAPVAASIRYRECLKNHAASIGGSIVDGCGEFMPSGEEGSLEALKCAACNCHRNFHRKEADGGDADFTRSMVHPLQLPPPLPSPSFKQHHKTSMGMHTNHWTTSIVPPMKMAFGGSAATDSSSEDLNFNAFQSNVAPPPPPPPPPFVLSKKRFRTKFTQEQKEKMLEFAEKVGWRIPKEDDPDVQSFCAEVGVKRQVFKVWMHNNKNSGKKQPPEES